jgi:Transmembrane family 220, helix
MRYVHMILCLTMLGFTAVQYNDPDALLWIVYYIVPAGWAYLAAFRPQILGAPRTRQWLWTCTLAWLGLVIFYWPTMANFWRSEVFMAEETAREGMGLMIAWGVILCALFSAHVSKPITALRTPTATRP